MTEFSELFEKINSAFRCFLCLNRGQKAKSAAEEAELPARDGKERIIGLHAVRRGPLDFPLGRPQRRRSARLMSLLRTSHTCRQHVFR